MLPAAGVNAAQFRLARNLADEQTENRGDRGNRQRNEIGPLPGVREADVRDVRATDVCPPPSFVAGLAGIRSRMPVGLLPVAWSLSGNAWSLRLPQVRLSS